jgi:hypothetical protein
VTEGPLERLLFRLIPLLEAAEVPYMVMGGLAVRVWGLPRSTFDLDLTLSLPPEELRRFCAHLEREGFEVPEAHRKGFADTLQGMGKFSFQDYETHPPVTVDCFVTTTEYQKEAFSRRRLVELEGRQVWMISPEDLLLHKLVAGRQKDLLDIDDLLLIQGQVDRAYLREWADALGVTTLLLERLPKE